MNRPFNLSFTADKMSQMCGGLSDAKEASPEVQGIADKVNIPS